MAPLSEFNRISFQLPLETFAVSAFITKEERMPIVTEYVLRLLRICGQLSVSAFQRYFGFSRSELVAVMETLSRQGLIVVSSDDITLSRYASAQFDASTEEYPLFAKVDPYHDDVTFDLLTFSPIKRRGDIRDPLGAIEIEIANEIVGHSVERAKQAFAERFPEIASMRDDLRHHAVSVYSIAEIHSKRRGMLPVPVSLSMGEAGQIERTLEEAFSRQASPELHNGFQQWVTDAIGANAHNRRGGRIEHFVDVFGLRWLRPYFNDRRFNLTRYVADVVADKVERVSEGVVPLFGNLYLRRNLERIRERIRYRVGRWKPGATATTIWVAPDEGLWGRGSALNEALDEIDVTQEQIEKRRIVLCVRCRDEDESAVKRRFDRATRGDQKELRLCPPLYSVSIAGDSMVEMLVFSVEFVVAMCHVAVEGQPGVFVPVGFVSNQEKHRTVVNQAIQELDSSLRGLLPAEPEAPSTTEEGPPTK
jgi:hypothetical protein